MPEAIYNTKNILEVSSFDIGDLKKHALKSKSKRYRLCMHHNNDDPTHEMLIVFYKAGFMPPHRHPIGKSESYHVVEGTMTVYFFDDYGNIKNCIDLEETKKGGDKPFLYRLSSNEWHMPVPTSEWLVYHETFTGPFEKDLDVEFPDWAPKEGDDEKIEDFMNSCNIYYSSQKL